MQFRDTKIVSISFVFSLATSASMRGAVLRNIDATVPLKTVNASRGKYTRAELVWAVTELTGRGWSGPRIRSL